MTDQKWFKTEQIETFVGKMEDCTCEEDMKACRKKLIVLHECGDDKASLIDQLKTMIYGLESNFENFAS